MAKLLVQHNQDPAIGVILEYVEPGTPGRPQGWHGRCTGCGRLMHWWRQDISLAGAQRHVDAHPAEVIGIDPSSIVR